MRSTGWLKKIGWVAQDPGMLTLLRKRMAVLGLVNKSEIGEAVLDRRSISCAFFHPAETRGQQGITRNYNPVVSSSAGGAKGCSDHRFPVHPQATLPNF